MKTFASIYIGSNEVIMKVFELSKARGLKEIDRLRKAIPLLSDVYAYKKVKADTMQKLLGVLSDMKSTLEAYRCDNYRLWATDALDQAVNKLFVLDQIRLVTGLEGHILSNSEHRFLSYQALAAMTQFEDIVKSGAVMIDISGSSLQMTLFEEGKIQTTQHIMMGVSTVAAQLQELQRKADSHKQVRELIGKELNRFVTMYMHSKPVKYMIILGEHASMMVQYFKIKKGGINVPMDAYRHQLHDTTVDTITNIVEDTGYFSMYRGLAESFLLMHRVIADTIPAENLVVPGITVTEGIAYDYAYSSKILKASHDFEEDVMQAAWFLSRRYACYQPHLEALESMTSQVFDVMKKYHGLSRRSRLLLRVAAVLHDCGKYISISDSAECSRMIILSSEILGLSHREREMVAMIVALNRKDNVTYDDVKEHFTEQEYLTIRKLLAMLKIANTMDRSHKQKISKMSMHIKDGRILDIVVEADDSMTLEKGIFQEKADAFEEIFAIRPVIRLRKAM